MAEIVVKDHQKTEHETAELPHDLPSPEDHPNTDVVIFDGECSFCLGQVKNLHRWDGRNRLSFISLHAPLVKERYPDLTHEMMMKQMYVVSRDGTRFPGAAAFRYLSRRLPRLWILAPILHIPFTLPIWQWGYQLVAKRRYKISKKQGKGCESGSCEIHFD